MKNIDIDRLYSVVEGKLTGRGLGKTFARCNEVAGLVSLGDSLIFCMISVSRDVRYIVPMMADVFKSHGLGYY